MELKEKLEVVKAELLAELQQHKEELLKVSEPVLKAALIAIVKKGIIPAVKAVVESTETKIDDIVWGAIDDKAEAMALELIEALKVA